MHSLQLFPFLIFLSSFSTVISFHKNIIWHNCILIKAATEWSVFASGVDLGRFRVLSGAPDRC